MVWVTLIPSWLRLSLLRRLQRKSRAACVVEIDQRFVHNSNPATDAISKLQNWFYFASYLSS